MIRRLFMQDPDNNVWRDVLVLVISFIAVMLICSLLSGCATTKQIHTADTLYVMQHDTLRETHVERITDIQYRDRLVDNFVKVNVAGDTIFQKVKEKEYVNVYLEKTDSLDKYRSLCDSLIKAHNTTTITKYEPSWYDKFRLNSWLLLLIYAVATTVAIVMKVRK